MEKNRSNIKAAAVNQCFFERNGEGREQNDNFHGWGDCESSRWEEERRPDHVTSPPAVICSSSHLFGYMWSVQTVLGSGDFAGDSVIRIQSSSTGLGYKQLQ